MRLVLFVVLGALARTEQQRDAVERWQLTYPLLWDPQLQLARSLGLPTFEFRGHAYFKRVTLVVSPGRIDAAL